MILYNQEWIKWQKIYMGKGIEPWGMTAWPFILFRHSKDEVTQAMINHETHHFNHQRRWLWFPFLYDIVYGLLLLKHGYWNHPWEVAARAAE